MSHPGDALREHRSSYRRQDHRKKLCRSEKRGRDSFDGQGFDEYMNLVLDDAVEIRKKTDTTKQIGLSSPSPPSCQSVLTPDHRPHHAQRGQHRSPHEGSVALWWSPSSSPKSAAINQVPNPKCRSHGLPLTVPCGQPSPGSIYTLSKGD